MDGKILNFSVLGKFTGVKNWVEPVKLKFWTEILEKKLEINWNSIEISILTSFPSFSPARIPSKIYYSIHFCVITTAVAALQKANTENKSECNATGIQLTKFSPDSSRT